MAEIHPFRAWRYSGVFADKIAELSSPLFDVVSQKQRDRLYANPYNSIHLSVPQGDDAASKAAERWTQWKQNGVVAQDPLPGIYVYYQEFRLPGSDKIRTRKGFIANIRLYDYDQGVLLRHENTILPAVNERETLLAETKVASSPTHGLYTDESQSLEQYMDQAMLKPLFETEDYQGVRDKLSVIHDAKIIRRFQKLLENERIILADGHHRYGGALAHMKKQKAANSLHTGDEAYNFHSMYFTNTASKDLRIFPTHRVLQQLSDWNEPDFLEKLSVFFSIREIEEVHELNEIIAHKDSCFGLLTSNAAYSILLKEEWRNHIDWQLPSVIKQLENTQLHYFILEKVLDIKREEQRSSPYLSFEKNFSACLSKVQKGEANFAVITREIAIEQVLEVCNSGHVMPQKSTYFYPKVISGFVFSSIEDEVNE
ncbi:MAG: DUF1015 domain-containing protein [Cyclobacteriaceae bacterium]|nr:DUF1015 domain-containing protein [Cyclobacteriaceae bacterium]MCH8517056.1 DUF1015 domain-containing protein [Cyclobacteriaceae bacterium]